MKQHSKISIPWFRARKQRSGTIHFFLEIPGNERRVEIPLGSDRMVALKKRAELLFTYFCSTSGPYASFDLMFDRYLIIMVPTLPIAQQNENMQSIKKLAAFFCESGSHIREPSRFDSEYRMWRDHRLTLRTRSEVALFVKIVRWHQDMLKITTPLLG